MNATSSPRQRIRFGVAMAIMAYLPPALAQGSGWLDQPTMTGDWDGARTRMEDAGVHLRAEFATESAGNLSGGRKQTARYTQQLSFGADLDMQRLAGIPNAKIQITFTDRVGRSLSADALGNQFSVQELYGAGQNFRLAELNWQQDFADHRIAIQLGWSPLGDDFAKLPNFCKFQNGVICGHANAMTTNSDAHNFPTAQWGARIKLRPKPGFYVATGVYQDNPNAGGKDEGFNLSLRRTGVFVPVELGWETGRGTGEMPGDYKIGAYYNSSRAPDVLKDENGLSAGLTGDAFLQHGGRSGGYVIASQTVYRVAPDSPRGLRLGVMAGAANRDTARFSHFWLAGGVWQGTFAGRDRDFVSLVIADSRTNPRLTQYQRDRDAVAPGSVGIQTHESIAELDYGAQIAPWLSVRPNIQYVMRPGATGKIPDAFVIGLYTLVTF